MDINNFIHNSKIQVDDINISKLKGKSDAKIARTSMGNMDYIKIIIKSHK